MPGPRRRHVPLRTCVACRQVRPKREMIRIVRTPEGDLEIDPKGKRSGRGTYLCVETGCGPAALNAGGLSRALKCQVAPADLKAIKSTIESMLDELPRPARATSTTVPE